MSHICHGHNCKRQGPIHLHSQNNEGDIVNENDLNMPSQKQEKYLNSSMGIILGTGLQNQNKKGFQRKR